MNEKPLYRNALRSKKMIKMAFLQLMLEKDISQIRVKQILDVADISKGTFYAHFRDVYDILEEIENEHVELLTSFLNEHPRQDLIDNFLPFISKVCKYIEANQDFYQMLFRSRNVGTFLNKLQNLFVDYMMEDKDMLKKIRSKEEAKLFFSFISIGTANLLQEWFTAGYTVSFDELANILNNCILHGISAILKPTLNINSSVS